MTVTKKRLLEILKKIKDTLEREDDAGYTFCNHCSASGWAFIEHGENCVVLEIRAMLGLCRHGFPGNYNHGEGECPPVKRA